MIIFFLNQIILKDLPLFIGLGKRKYLTYEINCWKRDLKAQSDQLPEINSSVTSLFSIVDGILLRQNVKSFVSKYRLSIMATHIRCNVCSSQSHIRDHVISCNSNQISLDHFSIIGTNNNICELRILESFDIAQLKPLLISMQYAYPLSIVR